MRDFIELLLLPFRWWLNENRLDRALRARRLCPSCGGDNPSRAPECGACDDHMSAW